MLIHFDDWHEDYDYWTEMDNVDIHPVGWFQQWLECMVDQGRLNSDGSKGDYSEELQPPCGNCHRHVIFCVDSKSVVRLIKFLAGKNSFLAICKLLVTSD